MSFAQVDMINVLIFFFQAEDGIRDHCVTGVQTCALPISSKSFVPEIRRVNVAGGNFRFLDRSGGVVAIFDGVKFRSSVRNAVAVRGNAQVKKISLRDSFFLEQLQSPLRYDPQELDLSQISAQAGGGEIAGHFTMQPQAADSPFAVG